MIQPLAQTDRELMDAVNKHFGVGVVALEFLPLGGTAWVYIATEANGDRCLVKFQRTVSSSLLAVTELLASARFAWTPVVHKARSGAVWVELHGLFMSLQRYLTSSRRDSMGFTPSEPYLVRLGGLLRELHRLAVPVSSSAIPRETFHSSFHDPAQAALRRLEEHAPGDEEAGALDVVKALFDRKRDDIATLFSNAVELGGRLKTRKSELVLTHGDVHFDNLIETADGHLYLIDWDWAMCALPAHDLMYLTDDQLVRVSRGYGTDLLEDTDALRYYRTHLMLRAIWFWLERALNAETVGELRQTVDILVALFDDSPFLVRALS